MDATSERRIVSILESGRDMTVATIREDGYPQATTVSYVNDGLAVCFGCNAASQKARNIARNDKVSLTVNLPYATWEEIRGLSIGGRAEPVTDPAEREKLSRLMLAKFPQIARYGSTMEGVALFRVRPRVVSILDYGKGFGHSELVEV